eukprot:TRINITY_DN14694_c0_g1_i1.p1 TRINITY_DN14694_c0_g1~~TRINITY_DN14694_c0_g1_i1.p1  ORF type:complete len:327 (+),score=62.98 TRINITY_DN14694_c0_g1_i1:40-981(+)
MSSPPTKRDPSLALSDARVAAARSSDACRVYRVYCDGVFDMFHIGHMLMLKQAKHALGNPEKTFLIAGVNNDADTERYKGKTVMDHKTRCMSVANCKWVDAVAEDAPWIITDEFIKKYNIDFVAHDAIPYTDTTGTASNSNDIYGHIKEKGMFLETKRTDGISTSDLILQIVRDYDTYVERNISRGYTAEQLNLGPLAKIKVAEHKKRKEVSNAIDNTKEHFQDFAQDFAKLFGKKNESGKERATTSKQEDPIGLISALSSLLSAIWNLTKVLISYINPASYLTPRQMGIIFSVIVAYAAFQAFLIFKAFGKK